MVTCFKPPSWGGANRLRQGYQLDLGIFSVFSQHSFFVRHVGCSPWIILSGFKAIWTWHTWPEACTWNSWRQLWFIQRPRLFFFDTSLTDGWLTFYSISCSKLGDIPWNLALNRPLSMGEENPLSPVPVPVRSAIRGRHCGSPAAGSALLGKSWWDDPESLWSKNI
jgi:hypothetical protein